MRLVGLFCEYSILVAPSNIAEKGNELNGSDRILKFSKWIYAPSITCLRESALLLTH